MYMVIHTGKLNRHSYSHTEAMVIDNALIVLLE